jgi:hypothetical protein
VKGLIFYSAVVSVVLLASILTLSGAGWPQSGLANKISHLTFSHPVQVPGATLPAGTYTFSLMSGPSANRRMVRVTSRSGDQVFATIMTIPDYRRETTEHTLVAFGEKGACADTTPIKAWFYPGERYGYRFIYPEEQAAKIASACNEPIPETSSESAKKTNLDPSQFPTLEKSDVRIITPSKQEEKYDTSELTSGDKADQSGFDADNNR